MTRPTAVLEQAAEHSNIGKVRRQIPLHVYKRVQAGISRRSLYPPTVFYTCYAAIVLIVALRSSHPVVGLVFFSLGLAAYTLVEYVFHRWILHGRFADGPGIHHFLHTRLDPSHWPHHDNAYDGNHINGNIRDFLPLFSICAPLTYIAPLYTLPVMLGGAVQGYVIEEWIHHSVHFYNFRDPYFRYIRRHHFYHHSPKGMEQGYGLTSGFWDVWFKTRYPAEVRWALYQRPKRKPVTGKPG